MAFDWNKITPSRLILAQWAVGVAGMLIFAVGLVWELRLDPIEQMASGHAAELAHQREEQARQSQEQSSQGAELASLRTEVVILKEELARLRSTQARHVVEINRLSEEFIVHSGEVNGKMKDFRFALDTMDVSRLPPDASPVERLDGGPASTKGAIWHVPGTIGCVSFVASLEFAVSAPATDFCQAATRQGLPVRAADPVAEVAHPFSIAWDLYP